MAVGREVEGLVDEVVTADHRLDAAGVVVDDDDRSGRLDAGQRVEGGALGGFLHVEVERRAHVEPAAERAAGAVLVDELLAQPLGEVRRERIGRGALDVGGRRQRDLGSIDVLRLVDVALLQHLLKDEVASGQRVLRVRAGREGGGRGDDPGEHRRLVRQQLGGAGVSAFGQALGVVLAEVGARGGLDPVGALAEVDGVQVLGQDLVLVPLALEVVGEGRLAQLLEHGPRVLRLERVLYELLRDGRGALDRAAGKDVLDHRSADPPEVHSLVLVEALVLDRDHGLLHVGVDVLGLDQDPAGVREQGAHLAALGVEDLGVLRLRVLLLALELGQVAGDGHHHPEDRRNHPQRRETDQDDRQAQLLDPAGLGLARAARADPLRQDGGAAGRARAVPVAVPVGAAPGTRRARHGKRIGDAVGELSDLVAASPQALAAVVEQASKPVEDGCAALRGAALLRLALEQGLEVSVVRAVVDSSVARGLLRVAAGGAPAGASRQLAPLSGGGGTGWAVVGRRDRVEPVAAEVVVAHAQPVLIAVGDGGLVARLYARGPAKAAKGCGSSAGASKPGSWSSP